MSLIRRLLSPAVARDEERVQLPPGYAYSGLIPLTASGKVVTPESAARSAAVTACQRVLTSTIASLPVDVVRTEGNRRVAVVPTPQVVRMPSGAVRQRVWVAQVVKSLVGHGNAYGQVMSETPRGFPAQVETINPRDVAWNMTPDGLKPHVVGKRHELWPVGDLVHVPASPFIQAGSPVADSPVELAKQSIGTALAAEEFGARFFGDGFHPTALAKSDQELTPEQAATIKQAINAMRHTREPGVFGAGLDVTFPEINPEDSQFIDLMRFEVEQACRFFGVPPSMVYAAVSGQNVTYANVSQADLQYLKHSVGIWLLDIEDAWSELLPSPQRVKFNVDGLLRMDAEARWKIHDLRLKNKSTSINRILALEDEEPIPDPDFDKPGIPGGPVLGDDVAGAAPEPRSERSLPGHLSTINVYQPPVESPNIHIDNHIPEARSDTPVVNVTVDPTPVHVDAPNVTVENTVPVPAVNVEPTPVTVNSPVTVQPSPVVIADPPKTRRVVRDAKGNIIKVTEE